MVALADFTGWSCVQGPAELVDWLVDRSEEVDYAEFAEHADVDTADLLDWQIEMLPTDWSVTFLKTDTPGGAEAWVLQHSGIEQLFMSEPWDYGREAALAEAMIGIAEDGDLDISELDAAGVERLRAAARCD
jgi:hypothetical protein